MSSSPLHPDPDHAGLELQKTSDHSLAFFLAEAISRLLTSTSQPALEHIAELAKFDGDSNQHVTGSDL
jgi:hypothetical protein